MKCLIALILAFVVLMNVSSLASATAVGDVNHDSRIDRADIDFLIAYIFTGGPAPNPYYLGDTSGDNFVDIDDVVYLVDAVYGDSCEAKYLDAYNCNGNYRQRLYQDASCNLVWKNLEYCSLGCSAGSCTAPKTCDVQINNINIVNDKINFDLKNNGNSDTRIYYTIYVNSYKVVNNVIDIAKGESLRIHRDYNFKYGDNKVKIEAWASCGDVEGEIVNHYVDYDYARCSPRYFNEFRCNGDDLQQRYMDSSCDLTWKAVKVCDYGCSNNRCVNQYYDYYFDYYDNNYYDYYYNQYYDYPYEYKTCYNGDIWIYNTYGERIEKFSDCDYGCYDGQCMYDYDPYRCDAKWICIGDNKAYRTPSCDIKSMTYCPDGCYNGQCMTEDSQNCGVMIGNFDYYDKLTEGSLGKVDVEVINTGNGKEQIELELFVNGVRSTSLSFTLDSGKLAQKTLYYTAEEGSQHLHVIAKSSCGSMDAKVADVTTHDTGSYSVCNNNNICEGLETESNCPQDCFTDQKPVTTTVNIIPNDLDTKVYKAKTVTVDIISAVPQDFTIYVSGIPQDWLNYENRVDVELVNGVYHDTSYIYVNPQALGVYHMDLVVHSTEENRNYQKSIDLFVAQEAQAGEETDSDGITGSIIDYNSILFNPLNVFLIIFAILILIIISAALRLRQ